MGSIFWLSGIAFSGYETFRRAVSSCKRFDMLMLKNSVFSVWNVEIAVQQWGWFADAQESWFHGTKHSKMCSSVEQWGQITDAQERFFQPSKRSNMCSALLVGGRFYDIQEFFFQSAKRSDMNCAELQGILLADCQEWCILAEKFPARGSIS